MPYEDQTNGSDESKTLCKNKYAERSNMKMMKILNHCYHDDYELYIIHLGEKLEPGKKYIIYIPYDGELKADLAGYYRSSYKDLETGTTR